MSEIDAIKINMNQDNLLLLNFILGFIMYGVALNLTFNDFKLVLSNPKGAVIGVFSQFLALPLLTFLLIAILKPSASVALGMIMVAACPGGNISNFMSSLAKANIALSVCLTAFASVLAIFMTPFNLAFWGSLYGPTNDILRVVSLDVLDVFRVIVTILGVPIILGMTTRHYFPRIANFLRPIMQTISIVIFFGFVIVMFIANYDNFINHIHLVIILVFLHNLVALSTGYNLGRLFGLPSSDRRTLAIETGIQNSALGLVLIFNFFDGMGGMALVAAWWGIWHIISGLSLASWWNRKKLAVTT